MIRYVIGFAAVSIAGALKKPAFLNEVSAESARTLVMDRSKLVASGAKATFDDVAETMSSRAKHAAERYEWVRKDGLAMVQASASNLWASKLETSSEEEDHTPRKSLAAVASVISTGLAAGTTAAMAAHYSRREHGDEPAEARRFFSRKKDDYYDDDDDGDVLRPYYYRPPPGSDAKPQQSTASDDSAVYHRPINTTVPLPADAAANCPAYYRQPKIYMGSTDFIPVNLPQPVCYSGSSEARVADAAEKPNLEDRPSYYRPRVSKDSAAPPARPVIPSYKRVVPQPPAAAAPTPEPLTGPSYFRDRLPLSAAIGAAA